MRRRAGNGPSMRMKPIRMGKAGFTLIEVMIALAVLATGLFVLLEAHSSALRARVEMRDEEIMRGLMQHVLGMAEVEAAAGNLSGSGDFGKRYPGCSYSFKATPMDEMNYPGLYEIVVTVEGPVRTEELRMRTFGVPLEQ